MHKRGSAAVLAMIFLVIFSALSCAFYVMINTAMQVGKNDRNAARARSAAESGMEVVKHHLSFAKVSGRTADAALVPELLLKLNQAMANSDYRVSTSPDGSAVEYPELGLNAVDANFTKARTFSAKVSKVATGAGVALAVAIDGFDHQSKLSRSTGAMFYARPAGRGIFEFDMAAAGGIAVNNGTIAGSGENGRANVLSASTATPSVQIENSQITGGLAVVVSENQVDADDRGQIQVSGFSTVGDIINAVNITDPPAIPEFETSKYLNLVTMTALRPSDIGNSSTMTNVVIQKSNTVTRIASGAVLNGIIYVKSPNRLEFRGGVTLNGIIIFEQSDSTTNTPDYLSFSGNLTQNPAASGLSAAVMEKLAGITIMAPTAAIMMTGSSEVKAEGSIICDKFAATASGFKLNVNNGTILTLSNASDSMYLKNGTITFSRTNSIPPTTGVIYYRQYVMDPSTYQEVLR